ncbi:MAG: HDOD domain-containing protein [Deltaproteobacteria bacterium]|nr:HDOD domain-containing protein [Deltaproteobacteria bacterium]
MPKSQKNFKVWLNRLSQEDMPIFGRTVQEIISVSEDYDSNVTQLVQGVLKDAAMTTKILKLANTALYNPTDREVNTVSRAITLLGFDSVRAICLTIALVESITQSVNRKYLIKEFTYALHAATQARALCKNIDSKKAEEVFVAALLWNVGELAFWCFAENDGEALISELDRGVSKKEAEMKVLGFHLSTLSKQLVKDWNLTSLLQDDSDATKQNNKLYQLVKVCRDLASGIGAGWKSEKDILAMEQMASLCGIMDKEEFQESVYENAQVAASVSKTYGVKDVVNIIPQPPGVLIEQEKRQEKEEATTDEGGAEGLSQYNSTLQLDILREMSLMLNENPDFNSLIQMALDGICRGIGMDRVLFAMTSADKQYIKARYAIGIESTALLNNFKFKLLTKKANIFRRTLEEKRSFWVGGPSRGISDIVTDDIVSTLGGNSFFLIPILVGGKAIGLFYADRIPSKRDLDQKSFQNMEFFALQTSLSLGRITGVG